MKRLSWRMFAFCASLLSGVAAQTIDAESAGQEPVVIPTRAEFATARLLNFDSPGRIPGYYYVQFRAADDLSQIPVLDTYRYDVLPGILPISSDAVEFLSWALAAKVGGTEVSPFSGTWNGFSVHVDSEESIVKLARDSRIDFIEPVMSLELAARQVLPSDNSMWHLDRIDQRQLPLNLSYDYSTTATAVTVHVIDSGIRASHVEFANRPQVRIANCFSADQSKHGCIDNFTSNSSVMDCNGHGTRMASLIGGTTFGVAKRVKLRGYVAGWGPTQSPSGVWSCSPTTNGGDSNDLIAALELAIANAANDGGPSIINLSVILLGINTAAEERVQLAINNGITVVAGAGNDTDNSCFHTPARMPSVITVAASNQADGRWVRSNFGPCVDLFAPGENLSTASNASDTASTGGRAGTSLSTALVSGIAALYLEDHALHNAGQVQSAILQAATSNALQGNLGCANPPGGSCSPNRLAYSLLAGPASGSLQFSASAFSVAENGTSITIAATRTGGSSGAVSVSYATSNGSAGAGSDYAAASGTLTWANGDTANKAFTVTMLDDSTYEGNETVNLTLSGPTGGAIVGSPGTATLTITDNETPPGTIQLSASTSTVAENATSIAITATRVGGSSGAVGVSYGTFNGTATAGSDYTSTSGTLSWANGDTANKTFAVNITDDAAVESSETFTVSISGPTGGAALGAPTAATVTITDNDTPVPSAPTNLRPSGIVTGTNWTMFWNASTGPVAYYVLQKNRDGNITNATINAPAHSSAQSGPNGSDTEYQVKACNSSNQCSGWSNQVVVTVCRDGVCP